MIEFLEEGLGILVEEEVPIAIVRREVRTGHQIFYKCSEMGLDEIGDLFKQDKIISKNKD